LPEERCYSGAPRPRSALAHRTQPARGHCVRGSNAICLLPEEHVEPLAPWSLSSSSDHRLGELLTEIFISLGSFTNPRHV